MARVELRNYRRAQSPLHTLFRLFRYFRHCRVLLICAVASILAYVACTIGASYCMRPLTNLLKESGITPNETYAKYLSLLAGLVARHIELRNQGQDGKQDQANQRRQCNHKAIGKGSARRGGQVGQDVEERERAVVKVLRQVAQQCKQGEQDRHLNQQRQTASHGVELVLAVELLHLLGLTLGIVGIALLDLEHLGLQHLHASRRLGRLEHKRRQQQTDDDHQDDDGQAPVDRKGLDELEQLEKDVNDPIPHVSFPPIASAR